MIDGEKSHEATPHRRQQARAEGHVAKSRDLASAAVLLLGLVSRGSACGVRFCTMSETMNHSG
jgi:flagellar biosynthesis protein FlhB